MDKMNPIRRYYIVPIVIAIVSIIVIFGADFWDEMPLGDLGTLDVFANIPGVCIHERC